MAFEDRPRRSDSPARVSRVTRISTEPQGRKTLRIGLRCPGSACCRGHNHPRFPADRDPMIALRELALH